MEEEKTTSMQNEPCPPGMKPCKVCGAYIAKNAKACPKCGAKNKKPIYLRPWFIILCVIILLIVGSSIKNALRDPAKDLYKEAQSYYKNAEYQQAISTVEKLQKDYPDAKCLGDAKQLRDDANEQILISEAKELLDSAESALSAKKWGKAVDNANAALKKVSDGDLGTRANDILGKAQKEMDVAQESLFQEIQSDYNSKNWDNVITKATDYLSDYASGKHADEARSMKGEAQATLAKEQFRITKAWVNGPDSAMGYELYINYKNLSNKTVKYVTFGVSFINNVGDVVSTWRIDPIEYCTHEGPVGPNQGLSGTREYWGKFYDSWINHPEIVSVSIEYTDGSKWTLSTEEVAAVQY